MTSSVRAALVFGPLAAVAILAACSPDATSPAGPTIAGAPRLALTAAVDTSTSRTCSDSVYAGYGNECTGGLCYEHFEYDPETGTEYVVTCDPEAADTSLTMTPSYPSYPPYPKP